MNNVTREQREIRFFRENESALLNRLGPGPAKYQCYNKGASSRHTYSIPRVSPHLFFLINSLPLGHSKHRYRWIQSPKTKEKSSKSCTFCFSSRLRRPQSTNLSLFAQGTSRDKMQERNQRHLRRIQTKVRHNQSERSKLQPMEEGNFVLMTPECTGIRRYIATPFKIKYLLILPLDNFKIY